MIKLYTLSACIKLLRVPYGALRAVVEFGIITPKFCSFEGFPLLTEEELNKLREVLDQNRLPHRKRAKHKTEMRRAEVLKAFQKPTATLASVGTTMGLSRERIRQLLPPNAAKEKQISRSALLDAQREKRLEGICQKHYKCNRAEYFHSVGLQFRHGGAHKIPLLLRWAYYKNQAQRFHAQWEITLPEFAELVGPHVHEIGRHANAKVVRRKDGTGPFSKDNLEVVTLTEGSTKTMKRTRNKQFLRCLEMLKKGVAYQDVATRLKRSISWVSQQRQIARNIGYFLNAEEDQHEETQIQQRTETSGGESN